MIIQIDVCMQMPFIVYDGTIYLQTMDRLKVSLEVNGINYTERRFETDKGVESLGKKPFVCQDYHMHANLIWKIV